MPSLVFLTLSQFWLRKEARVESFVFEVGGLGEGVGKKNDFLRYSLGSVGIYIYQGFGHI